MLLKFACKDHVDLSKKFVCFDHFPVNSKLSLLSMSEQPCHVTIIFIFSVVFCNLSFPTKASTAFLPFLISRKSNKYNDFGRTEIGIETF